MLFITSIPHYLGSYLGQKSYSLRSFFALWFGKTQTSFLWPSFNTFTDFFSSKKKKWSSVFHLELRSFLVPLKSFFELWCWRRLESPLDCKEIHPVNPKGDQSWVFIGRTDAEAETSILWPLDVKNWHIGKDLILGKIEGGRRREWQRMRWLIGIT